MPWQHSVTDSRGQEHQRVSMHRQYAFAIVAHYPERTTNWDRPRTFPAHSSCNWSRNRIYAEQYAADRLRHGAEATEVIAVTPVEVKPKRLSLIKNGESA